jgi:hypothetical protein
VVAGAADVEPAKRRRVLLQGAHREAGDVFGADEVAQLRAGADQLRLAAVEPVTCR